MNSYVSSFLFVGVLSAVLQAAFRRALLAIALSVALGMVWLASESHVFFRGQIDGVALAYFIGFSPISGGLCLLAATIGLLVASAVLPKQGEAIPAPANNQQVVELALEQYRGGGGVRVKCLACGDRVQAARVLSSTGGQPDIKLVCGCGDCSGVHPFYGTSA